MERFNLSLTSYLREIDEGLIPTGATTYAYLYVPSGTSYETLIYKTPDGTKLDLLKNITTVNVADLVLSGSSLNVTYSDGTTSGITLSSVNTTLTGGTYTGTTLTLNLSDASTIDILNVKTNPAGVNNQIQLNSSGVFGSVSNFTLSSGVLNVPTGITTNYITLGSTSVTTNGTIRFNGTNFQGRKSGSWVNLDGGGTDTYVTGGTLNGTNLSLELNNGGTASAIDLSILTSGVGTGTQNYLSKWDSTTGLTNSIIQDDGTTISINNSATQFSISDTVATLLSGNFTVGSTSGSTTLSGTTGLAITNSDSGDLVITNLSTDSGSSINLIATGASNSTLTAQIGSTNPSTFSFKGGLGSTSTITLSGGILYTIGGIWYENISGSKTTEASTQTITATSGLTLNGYSQSLVLGQSGTTISGQIVNTARRVEHLIGNATFYSGGGDDEGAFTGDYSIYIGEEAASGATNVVTYPVNTGLGYGVLKGSTNMDFITAIGGGAGRNTSRDESPYAGAVTAGGVLIGTSAGRDIDLFNQSVLIGASTARGVRKIFRSTIVGNDSFQKDSSTGTTLHKVTTLGSYTGYDPVVDDAIYSHVIAVGHETLLQSSGATDSVLIGDYIGINKRVDDSIIIGNYRTSGSTFIELTGVTSNVISFGNNLVPLQEYTVNVPTNYNLGLGTLEPTEKLHVNGNLRLTGGLFDSSNSTGTTNQVLTTTPSGITWADATSGGVNYYVTGGTISNGTLTLNRNDNNSVTVTGFTEDSIYVTGGTATNTTLTLRRANATNIGIDISSAGAPAFGVININQGTTFNTSTSTIFESQVTKDRLEFQDSEEIAIIGLYDGSGASDFGLRFNIIDNSLTPTHLNSTGAVASNRNVVLNGSNQFRYEHSSIVHGTVTVNTSLTNVNVADKSIVVLDSGGTSSYGISGFTGGVTGQVVYVIKENINDTVSFAHNNGVTSQPLYTLTAANISLEPGTYQSFIMIFNGTNWYQVSNHI